ncbi:MAG: hypothetical protein EOQ40_17405 [Mesorhizobium sp.]|uniref:hypothetical protein n=1 Tax=Mesorhizobium sp. TaxID=1871066 RepID=UPI000FE5E1AA|nr:hypothetical protein [Mesorhizobium sp.]RWB19912.1 MAG: hypothetical protein EOQ40_17405 [Mesorhizobium sp.]
MKRDENDLEQVERHVLRREHIARQYQIIAEFKGKGFPTDEAEEMLKTLLDLQRQHEEHLGYIRNKLGLAN